MAEQLSDAVSLFDSDDGSLPEVQFDVPNPDSVRDSYLFVQACASRIESRRACYWSRSQNIEVPITIGDDPVAELIAGNAESFHVVFGGVVSPSGYRVPPLGVFVFLNELAIDYRMGKDWDIDSIGGFFEILDRVAVITGVCRFDHKENDNDADNRLLEIWTQWRASHAA